MSKSKNFVIFFLIVFCPLGEYEFFVFFTFLVYFKKHENIVYHEVSLDNFDLQFFRGKSSEMKNGVDLDIFGSSIGLRFALDVSVD
jgi:hypothetical protein